MKYFVINKFGQQQLLEEQPEAFEQFLCTEGNEDILHATHTEHGDMLWHLIQDESCDDSVALDKCRYSIYGCYTHILSAYEDYCEEFGTVTLEDIQRLRDWLDDALHLADAKDMVHIYGI